MPQRHVDSAAQLGAAPGTTLVAIGNFDGVHRGHRAVLRSALDLAAERDLRVVVLTFHPHPAEVLGRGPQPVLTPLGRKVQLLCELDPDLRVVTEPFTKELAATSAEVFASRLLGGQLGARLVIVGQNFRFGRGRQGDLAVLERCGAAAGFEARALPLVGDESGPFSSSRARSALHDGDLVDVERVLGRPHALTGAVVLGDGRGKTIGFPTANLAGVAEVLPPYGVYAGLVHAVHDDGSARPLGAAVANIGVRPTVEAGLSVEAHLLDYHGDLYGHRLRLHLLARLRDERRFAGLDELRAQIGRDASAAADACRVRLEADGGPGTWYTGA